MAILLANIFIFFSPSSTFVIFSPPPLTLPVIAGRKENEDNFDEDDGIQSGKSFARHTCKIFKFLLQHFLKSKCWIKNLTRYCRYKYFCLCLVT